MNIRQAGRKGGKATLKKLGKAHYVNLANRRWKTKKSSTSKKGKS